jgi:hypothetical protein
VYSKKLVSLCILSIALFSLIGCGGSSAKPSVSVSATPTTVDATDTANLTATVANDKNSAGVSWTVSGGGTLSSTTTTAAKYTAPSASSSAVTVTVTATSIADTTKTATATITVPAAPAVTTGALVAGTVGTAYSGTLAASGGIPPFTWTLTSGTLPAGINMNAAGVLSGTPTAAGVGTTNLTFKVTDSGTATAMSATATLGLTIAAAPAITFTTTTATLAKGTYKSAYTSTVTATGGAGALTYTLLSGALPAGLTMSPAGAITGSPTVVGSFPFTVQAADAFGDTGTQALTLTTSYPALAVTPLIPPTGYAGSTYTSTTLAATGGSGTGYTWSLANGTAVPAGMGLSSAGVISGKPTTAGTTPFTVMVTDSASNTATLALSIVVNPAVSISTATALPVGYVGSAYSQTLAATGGSGAGYTWTVNGGSTLPGGLNLSGAGLLSGTPTTSGTPSFTVTVTDSASNTASATFSMTINAGISITTPTTLPGGYQNGIYPITTLAATGGNGGPYTWTWAAASGSSLPAGLILSTAGVITGTPTGSGTFSIVVTATDSASNKGSATFTVTIEAALAVTPTTLKSGTVNVAYTQTLAATGGSGTGYTWVTTGPSTLASLNLSLSAAGVVSGTPTTTGTATFTAQVTDSQTHTATASLSVSVFNALTVTTTTLPAGNVGTAYSQTLNAGGGTGTGYTWAATSSNLAGFGLSLSTAGVVSGTPTASGTVSFTANVTDSGNNTALQALSITVYSALALPTPNPITLSAGTTGVAYSGSVSASGGSGTYSFTVTGLPADGLNYSVTGGTVNITGTPSSAQTVSFGVSVKDSVTNVTIGPLTYTITVTNPAPVTLPSPNPTSLPSATINQSYSGSINSAGGIAPFTWSINGTAVLSNGTPLALTNGLSASSTGGSTLTITGTPTATGTVTLTNVKVADALSSNASNTYTIAVNAAGSQVSGQIFIPNNCGVSTLPAMTVSINTTPVQTTTSDGSGNYSFASIPNGTYTITPSITGASSVFWPATITNVVVNNSAVTGQTFRVNLGYTVSGTVSYAGASTGHIYLSLNNTNCGGGGGVGTSITAPGSFTIHGVPPGNYNLQAWMDLSTLANGDQNTSDPSGSVALPAITSSATGVSITLSDPVIASPPSANPTLSQITAGDQGVTISYKPVNTSSHIEDATSYDVQWSTSSTFATSPVTYNFKATGNKGDVWILNNATAGVTGNPFTNGQTYYFQARARNAVGAATGWNVYGGATPTGITIGTSTTGNTITGTVTIPAGVAPTGPLYVGFYNQNTGNVYGLRIAAPVVGGNAYSVNVPSASGYFNFAILDQNNDGMIDAGDVTNTDSNGQNSVTVSGNLTGQNISLPSAGATAAVTTQYSSGTTPGGNFAGYNLNFNVRAANKLPVAVQLISGPNVINPVDISNACQGCGSVQFQMYTSIGGFPTVGDSYSFNVTYSDGTTSTVTAAVTAFGTGTTVVGASDLATNLAPNGTGTNTTPTFTWTDPVGGSAYTYSFYLSGNIGTIWQIPGNNSNSNGFTSSTTSITWGTDPTGGGSTPLVGSLSSGAQYNWSITIQDSNGNQAQSSVYYIPVAPPALLAPHRRHAPVPSYGAADALKLGTLWIRSRIAVRNCRNKNGHRHSCKSGGLSPA